MKIRKAASTKDNKEYRNSLHYKHRMRMKECFRKFGFDGFMPHNILELLLFYVIPRKDTNETAHMLLNEFGSIAAVLDAPIEALMRVEGIGIEAATFLKVLPALFRAYEASKHADRPVILSSESAMKYLASFYTAVTFEKFVVVYLDGNGRVIHSAEITQHAKDKVFSDLTTIVKSAVSLDARGIVISHNHVDGFAVPSDEDKRLTEELAKLCQPLKIHICDHILFAGNDCCSFSKSKHVKAKYLAF